MLGNQQTPAFSSWRFHPTLIAFSGCEWRLIYKLHYAAADLILEVLGLTLLMLVKMDEISLSIINFEIVVDKDIYTVVKLIITLE